MDIRSTPLDRADPLPLWAQLRDHLGRRIGAGEFEDDAFPSEHALQVEYDVSRHTVRQALRELRTQGLITVRRGRGVSVRPVPIEQPLGALYSLFQSVEQAGLSQRSVVRCLDERADGVIAARLGLEESTPLVYVERLRCAGETPLAVDRAWMPAAHTRDLLHADFSHTGLYVQLRQRCGIQVTAGNEHLQAAMPSAAERELLQLPETEAALRIHRLGLVEHHPFEWRTTLVRGDQFAVSAQWSPHRGYALDVAAFADTSPAVVLHP